MRHLGVVVLHEGPDDFAGRGFLGAGQEALVAAHHPTRAHSEKLHHGKLSRAREAQEVEVVAFERHHALLDPEELVHRVNTVPHPRRLLEILTFCRHAHTGLQRIHYARNAPLEQILDLRHRAGVLGGVSAVHAGREAAAHVIVQTRSRALLEGDYAVFSQRQHGIHQVFDPSYRVAVRVGAIVGAAVLDHPPGDNQHRPGLGGDFQKRVVLVVLEQHVVVRTVLLDEVGLENQRLDLGVGGDELERRGFTGEPARFAARLEVLLHPASQIFGLANVDGTTRSGPKQVNAAELRQGRKLLEQHPVILRSPLSFTVRWATVG